MEYNILAIDVWGNKKDGFELNSAYTTNLVANISPTAKDVEVIKAIRKACGHRADARGYVCSVNDEYYIAIDCAKTGQPCYRAERSHEQSTIGE
jgi:hypothetical protein